MIKVPLKYLRGLSTLWALTQRLITPRFSGKIQQALARNLTIRYLLALGTIAFLAIAAQILIQKTLTRQTRDREELNIATQQRIIGQNLNRSALALQLASRKREVKETIDSIIDLANQLDRGQKNLEKGAQYKYLQSKKEEDIKKVFGNLEPSLSTIVAAAHFLSLHKSQALNSQAPTYDIVPPSRQIAQAEAKYRQSIENLITLFEQETGNSIRRMQKTEMLLLVLTLFVLLVEGLFIFRPAIQSLSRVVSELETNEALIRAILEASPDAIIPMDHKGSIIDANPAAEKALGYRRDEMIGRKLTEMLLLNHKGTESVFTNPYISPSGARMLNRPFDVTIKQPSGKTTLLEGSVTPTFTDKQPVFTAFLRDVTKRKHAEEELKQSAQELQKSNDELERFAYVASHDLQEPLRIISSYVNLLGKRYQAKLDADAHELIGFAIEGTARMRQLITDLLNYSRLQKTADPYSNVDCNKIVDRVLGNLHLSIEECQARIQIGRLPTLKGIESQLSQLFQNLLSNAVKFRGNTPPIIHVNAEKNAEGWLFSIKDNGIGFEMQNAENIFEAFKRLHSRSEYPGTGIGLAICKKVIETHGGRIWADSSPGKGTTFFFVIPENTHSLRDDPDPVQTADIVH